MSARKQRTPHYRYGTSCVKAVCGGDSKLHPDLLICTPPFNYTIQNFLTGDRIEQSQFNWDRIRVVGELKSNAVYSNHANTIIQLAGYVRQIFLAQPNRRFVHGFTLCSDNLRAWIFDRSGCLGSDVVSINKEPELFLRVMCKYASMDATEVGFDPTIRWVPRPISEFLLSENSDAQWLVPCTPGEEFVYDTTVAAAAIANNYCWLDKWAEAPTDKVPIPYPFVDIDTSNGEHLKLQLDPEVIFRSNSIVSRGTLLWRARTDESPGAEWKYAVKGQWRHTNRSSEADLLKHALNAGVNNIARYVSHQELCTIAKHVRHGLHSKHPWAEEKRQTDTNAEPMDVGSSKKRPSQSHGVTPRSSKRQKQGPPLMPPPKPKPVSGLSSQPSCSRVLANKAKSESLEKKGRSHSRLVLSPLGHELTDFHTFAELLAAFKDAIEGRLPAFLLAPHDRRPSLTN